MDVKRTENIEKIKVFSIGFWERINDDWKLGFGWQKRMLNVMRKYG